MSITFYSKEKQAKGAFDNGSIIENKPIGFPQDGGELLAYSNLFYWAHAISEKGGLIGEHPHRAFEILSFVLKGEIEHYDNKAQSWKTLQAGDVQIIRAGSGISHAEKFNPGAEIFQIWFDPSIQESVLKPASYDDYDSDRFPVAKNKGVSIRTFKGKGSPLLMETQGIEITEITLEEGEHTLDLDSESVYSVYVLEGLVGIDDTAVDQFGFALVKEQDSIKIAAKEKSKLFVIRSPLEPSYQTYAQGSRV